MARRPKFSIPGRRRPACAVFEKLPSSRRGANHRFGLHDMVMVKDNHLAANFESGGPARRHFEGQGGAATVFASNSRPIPSSRFGKFVRLRRSGRDSSRQHDTCPSCAEAELALQAPGHRLRSQRRCQHWKRSARVAETGVDFISVGEMTHSAQSRGPLARSLS